MLALYSLLPSPFLLLLCRKHTQIQCQISIVTLSFAVAYLGGGANGGGVFRFECSKKALNICHHDSQPHAYTAQRREKKTPNQWLPDGALPTHTPRQTENPTENTAHNVNKTQNILKMSCAVEEKASYFIM